MHRYAGSLGNLPLVLVPAIAAQASIFSKEDGQLGLAYVFCSLVTSGIATFSVGGYFLRQQGPVALTESQQNDQVHEQPAAIDVATSTCSPRAQDTEAAPSVHSSRRAPARVVSPAQAAASAGSNGLSPDAMLLHDPLFGPSNAVPDVTPLQRHLVNWVRVSLDLDWLGPSTSASTATELRRTQDCAAPRLPRADHDEEPVTWHKDVCALGVETKSESRVLVVHRESSGSGEDHDAQQRITAYKHPQSADEVPRNDVDATDVTQARPEPHGLLPPAQPGASAQSEATAKSPWRAAAAIASTTILNVPVLMVLLALFVGLIPAVKRVFFAEDEETQPPLDVIANTLARLSTAAIPSMMVALGGSLSRGPGAKLPWLTLASLCAIRLVVSPVLGAACVFGLRAAGAFDPPDDMFMLVLLLQHAMPSALTMYTLAAVNNSHADEVATMLFWQYMLSIITIPTCVGVFLVLI